jgi:hypothetical protein
VKPPVPPVAAKKVAFVVPVVDENDLDGAQLQAALSSLEEEELGTAPAGPSSDEELAQAGGYDAVDNMDEEELARVDAKL